MNLAAFSTLENAAMRSGIPSDSTGLKDQATMLRHDSEGEKAEEQFPRAAGEGEMEANINKRTLLLRPARSEHAFPTSGRTNLINACRFPADGDDAEWILLAIEDDSDPSRAEAAIKEGG